MTRSGFGGVSGQRCSAVLAVKTLLYLSPTASVSTEARPSLSWITESWREQAVKIAVSTPALSEGSDSPWPPESGYNLQRLPFSSRYTHTALIELIITAHHPRGRRTFSPARLRADASLRKMQDFLANQV